MHVWIWVLAHAAWAIDVDILGLTTWVKPERVDRCPIHKEFTTRTTDDGSLLLDPPGGGKFSVAEAELPDAARLGKASTGLILRYSAKPGADGISLWRVRVHSSDRPYVRFVHLFSIPADGVANETRHMPWSDWRGQVIKNRKIVECKDRVDDECTIHPERITHISFLESEDTITHSILLHQVIVTTREIYERNATQHHTDEAEALLWEREHRMFNMQELLRNYSRRRNTSTSTLAPVQSTTLVASTQLPAEVHGTVVSGARALGYGFRTCIAVIGALSWSAGSKL